MNARKCITILFAHSLIYIYVKDTDFRVNLGK